MRFVFGWFVLFLFTAFVLGWMEVGLTYMLCDMVIGMNCFWPILGVCVTINLILSCAWNLLCEQDEVKKLKGKIKQGRGF